MKKINLFTMAILALGVQNTMAQVLPDNDDTNVDQHELQVLVPEVALLDIWNFNTGQEANQAPIVFDMAEATTVGTNAEAGLYDFAALIVEDLYLNFTSVVSAAEPTRIITARLDNAGTFPGGVKLIIDPVATSVEGGDVNGFPADITGGAQEFNQSDLTASTSKVIANNIGSVYSGDEQFGVQLAYTIAQDGNFSSYIAGAYSTDVIYTLSDN